MRLVAVNTETGPTLCRVEGETAHPLAATSEEARILGFSELQPAGDTEASPIDLTGAKLAAPVRPGKIVAIGLNYLDHIRETGMEEPKSPLIFTKFNSSIIGPEDAIEIPTDITERVDWEVELGVIIGRRAKRVSVDEALDCVFGYTVANDVSARDVQFGDGQWVRGKSLDTFCPLGPAVLTRDEIPDPQDLPLSTIVNDDVVQNSSTSEMLFGVADLISFSSMSFTLEPGDIILTGTPWGCGEFMDPPRSLTNGDRVTVKIDPIGSLSNPVVTVS